MLPSQSFISPRPKYCFKAFLISLNRKFGSQMVLDLFRDQAKILTDQQLNITCLNHQLFVLSQCTTCANHPSISKCIEYCRLIMSIQVSFQK